MGGIGLPVLRRLAPDVHRPFRLQAARVIAPLGFLAALMIVYWSGFQTLVNVFAAVFIGLAVFVWYYAPNEGWISRPVGAVLGIVFAVVWVVVNKLGGWVLTVGKTAAPGSVSFPVFFVMWAGSLIAFTIILWVLSSDRGRFHIQRSAWLLFLLIATFLVSYVGEYGPLSTPLIRFPVSDLVEVAIGLVAYYWATASGFVTEELSDLTGQPVEEPGSGPQRARPELGHRPA